MEDLLKTEKVYTVLELNSLVQGLIKKEFPNYIWVCGEIQGLRTERDKKHTYFELVQKHPKQDSIIAKARVALFANRKPLIFRHIRQTQGTFELKNDVEVKFLCEVSLHPPTGQYSLIIIDIDPAYTLGKFAQNRLRIIEELRKEGIFERNKSLKIPDLPLRVGLITARDSAAYHDFINELTTSGYGFKVFTYNSYMQGKSVERDVITALRVLGSLKIKLDVIVITRGGGSRADLSWFDNKKIAIEISNSDIPVLSALGHHIDVSVVDLVAHTSFKTPTKVAQFLVERNTDAVNNMEVIYQRLIDEVTRLIKGEAIDLKTIALKIDSQVNRYFRDSHKRLAEIKSTICSVTDYVIRNQSRFILESIKTLKKSSKRGLQDLLHHVKYAESKIQLLNPRTILKRGYSITLKGGKTVKSTTRLKNNDLIKTIYFNGESISQIKELGVNNAKEIF